MRHVGNEKEGVVIILAALLSINALNVFPVWITLLVVLDFSIIEWQLFLGFRIFLSLIPSFQM